MVFDIIFIVIFIWAAYKGFSKGLLVQAATFAALVVGIFGAVKFSGYTTSLILNKTNLEGEYLPLISFALTFIAIVILVHFSARVIEKLIQAVALGFVNRIAGSLFSISKWLFLVSTILVVINTIHSYKPFLPEDKIKESRLYKPVSGLAPLIFPYLKFNKVQEFYNDADQQLHV